MAVTHFPPFATPSCITWYQWMWYISPPLPHLPVLPVTNGCGVFFPFCHTLLYYLVPMDLVHFFPFTTPSCTTWYQWIWCIFPLLSHPPVRPGTNGCGAFSHFCHTLLYDLVPMGVVHFSPFVTPSCITWYQWELFITPPLLHPPVLPGTNWCCAFFPFCHSLLYYLVPMDVVHYSPFATPSCIPWYQWELCITPPLPHPPVLPGTNGRGTFLPLCHTFLYYLVPMGVAHFSPFATPSCITWYQSAWNIFPPLPRPRPRPRVPG